VLRAGPDWIRPRDHQLPLAPPPPDDPPPKLPDDEDELLEELESEELPPITQPEPLDDDRPRVPVPDAPRIMLETPGDDPLR
jgi:hypothetical protein